MWTLLGSTFPLYATVSLQFTILADAANQVFRPIGLALSNAPFSGVSLFHQFQLTSSTPTATLDYGVEVAGYPSFEVLSLSETVQIEVKYSEEFQGLNENWSDGPLPFAVALANTYRVETFSVAAPGNIDSFLIQGGQRWQSIRLLTNGSVTFSNTGFTASVPVTDIDDLPGGFKSDNTKLNEIWKLGARAAGVSCLEKGSQKSIWEVDAQGAFVRGMRAGISAKGAFFENYTLEFDAKIERAGLGWVVAHPLASPAKGIQLNLVGNLPPNTTFFNTNTSLTPPNSVLLGYGYSFVNVTTLTSYHLGTFNVPFSVAENTWYRIKTILSGGAHLSVSINATEIFTVDLNSYYIGKSATNPSTPATIPLRGSFGFGGWQDQAGYFKDVVVYDSTNNTILYQIDLQDEEQVLAEFGVHENYAAVCLDGPKRDRLLWLGDFLHTIRIIGASTSRMDIARSTLQTLLDWQIPSGLLPYDAPIGYSASIAPDAFSVGGGGYLQGYEVAGIVLPDYQILAVLAFTNYVAITNDLDFARATWSQWKLNLAWVLAQVNGTTGLLSLAGAFLGPSSQGSAINCVLVEALSAMADVASALADTQSESEYRSAATDLTAAINSKLWSDTLGTYSLSTSSLAHFSVAAIAFCITSGTANPTQAKSSLLALEKLKNNPGYKDSTLVNASSRDTNISPNTNGFLLAALLSQPSGSQLALDLLLGLWTKMLNNNETSTGASWEYVNHEGNPGLGLFTSLSHPWGGAPTYLLTEYVVGIQKAEGVYGFGYGNWTVNPDMGWRMGLQRTKGRVETSFGKLQAEWWVRNGTIQVEITAPVETMGRFGLGRCPRF